MAAQETYRAGGAVRQGWAAIRVSDEAARRLGWLLFFISAPKGVPSIGKNQNGARIRLVVPWKYGFKGAKSIVTIRFTTEQPKTAWNVKKPHEYGFYANVNPRWRHSIRVWI